MRRRCGIGILGALALVLALAPAAAADPRNLTWVMPAEERTWWISLSWSSPPGRARR
jgi:ABC-type sugar transport system substrate-binding protein